MINSILTITLNPTVDKSTSVENIKPEKKLRCSPPKYEPGGGGINVSRGLVRLGIENTALFTAGGRTGERLIELLKEEKVATSPIKVSAETRENFIVVDTLHNEQYRFGMPGDSITPEENDTILKKILALSPTPEVAVISGSLPPGVSTAFIGEITRALKDKGTKIIADTSGDALQEILKEGIFLLKPNLGELSNLTGIEELDNELADDAAMKLINEGKAEVIVVSLGPQGAHLVTKTDNVHIPAPSVKKLSTVGAGDSMVAGMVYGIVKGYSSLDIARMGVACGSAATMNPGTGLFKPQDAERLFSWLCK
ncbi:1-phosphofructokinase family hexose kinase [Flavobacterium rhizosphaerae]|uniref:1-phosphofructokinase family hexose kinase n=1 Tax=Flavobacterium rhizosphaerae TaxID=3163298 RepID=A0ABW8YV80_9FLAO